jgi:hypothetical protein
MYKGIAKPEYHAFRAAAKFNKLRGINEGAEFNFPRLHSPSPKTGYGELVRSCPFSAKANARRSTKRKSNIQPL